MSRPAGFMGFDASITSLTGSSQQAIAANAARTFLQIQNTGNANVGVNYVGGTAAIGGTGTVTLTPGAVLTLDIAVPQAAVNVIGTAAQPLTVIWG